MNAQSFSTRSIAILRKVAIYELPLIILAIVVCLLRGSLTLSVFGSTLAILGVMLIGFAVISGFDGNGGVRTFGYQMGASASQSIQERMNEQKNNRHQARGFLGTSLISGTLAIAIGLILFFTFYQ
jgi:hypothetical protein